MNLQLKDKFDKVADKYDVQRKYLVPCLEDFYGIATEIIDSATDRPKVLDMGAGTGLFTSYVYNKYVHGHYTLIDLSSEMLDIAKERFEACSGFDYIVGDYSEFEGGEDYDVVISALSIHHLTNEGKQLTYSKAYQALKPGGIFVNADQVLGSSKVTETMNRKNWLKRIEASPLTGDEKNAAYSRMAMDQMATLEDNIEMMKRSGFKSVEVYYKYYNFAVLCGVKST